MHDKWMHFLGTTTLLTISLTFLVMGAFMMILSQTLHCCGLTGQKDQHNRAVHSVPSAGVLAGNQKKGKTHGLKQLDL